MLNEWIQSLMKRHSHDRTIIGIDGLGVSGKTTLAQCIQRDLLDGSRQTVLIHLDDHIMPSSNRYGTGMPQWREYYELHWDVIGLKSTLFDFLTSPHLLFHVPFYDKHTDRIIQKQLDVQQDAVVLVEGVFLQRPEWIGYFDAVIFVDCPFPIRKRRVISRDGYLGNESEILKAYQNRYWPAEDYYMATMRPMEHAIIYHINDEWSEFPCDD
ncbi:uridine kinase [Rossellomorea marisflavi]|uniref:uridine kinase n=1 Tax=Rossellomorea marisflavi TaxID=189381 RepID=UPI00204072A6|nr:uridine kinase [Rossellomorea marisflavi]MCM2604033.1 uridine kinase [Rossellomorea marisflavi]